MKKVLCLLLALSMLLASGCAGSMSHFAVVLAKRSAAMTEEREAAAVSAKAEPVVGMTERLFAQVYKEGENLAFSPVSIWLALAMLSDTAAGKTRTEILDALGVSSPEEARGLAEGLMTAETFNESKAECAIANSVWLNENISYNRETLKTLGDVFRADSFSGSPADAGYSRALRQWLDSNTKGLLKGFIDGISFDRDLAVALASTIYFDAEWEEEFKKESTGDGIFHAPTGDVTREFMHKTESLLYTEGEGFRAVGKPMKGSTVMWFILPDEGASLLTAANAFVALNGAEHHEVQFAMPKLDVASELDLIPALRSLGMNGCFSPGADFSPLTEDVGVYVDSVIHAARIKADEKRVRAAAFTLIQNKAMCADPGEIIEFTLDRPFLFAVTGATGAPLFAGAVNDPVK